MCYLTWERTVPLFDEKIPVINWILPVFGFKQSVFSKHWLGFDLLQPKMQFYLKKVMKLPVWFNGKTQVK